MNPNTDATAGASDARLDISPLIQAIVSLSGAITNLSNAISVPVPTQATPPAPPDTNSINQSLTAMASDIRRIMDELRLHVGPLDIGVAISDNNPSVRDMLKLILERIGTISHPVHHSLAELLQNLSNRVARSAFERLGDQSRVVADLEKQLDESQRALKVAQRAVKDLQDELQSSQPVLCAYRTVYRENENLRAQFREAERYGIAGPTQMVVETASYRVLEIKAEEFDAQQIRNRLDREERHHAATTPDEQAKASTVPTVPVVDHRPGGIGVLYLALQNALNAKAVVKNGLEWSIIFSRLQAHYNDESHVQLSIGNMSYEVSVRHLERLARLPGINFLFDGEIIIPTARNPHMPTRTEWYYVQRLHQMIQARGNDPISGFFLQEYVEAVNASFAGDGAEGLSFVDAMEAMENFRAFSSDSGIARNICDGAGYYSLSRNIMDNFYPYDWKR